MYGKGHKPSSVLKSYEKTLLSGQGLQEKEFKLIGLGRIQKDDFFLLVAFQSTDGERIRPLCT